MKTIQKTSTAAARQDLKDTKLAAAAREIIADELSRAKPFEQHVIKHIAENKKELLDLLTSEAKIQFSDDVRDAIEKTIANLAESVNDFVRHMSSEFDDRVLRLDKLASELEKKHVEVVEIRSPVAPPMQLGLVHKDFKRVLNPLTQKKDVLLVGPAGSGKGTAAKQLAQALGMGDKFYTIRCSEEDSPPDWFGYFRPHDGVFQETAFTLWYRNGGVLLLDELDASNKRVTMKANGALTDGHTWFGDEKVDRHRNAYLIAAANTHGHGADMIYRGRSPLDGAFINRFYPVAFGYDEVLELKISPLTSWTKLTQHVRKLVEGRKQPFVISPRNSINGGDMLLAGEDIEYVEFSCLYAGMPELIVQQIKNDSTTKQLRDNVFKELLELSKRGDN